MKSEPTSAKSDIDWQKTVDEALDRVRQEQTQESAKPAPAKSGSKFKIPPSSDKPEEISCKYIENEQNQVLLRTVPQPFLEPEGSRAYEMDNADRIVPSPGFVSDFVNMGRGTETPTLFLMWGALWTLSTVLSREAWLEWYPKPLWPNLYMIFIAPPGLCKKSMPIDFGMTLLDQMPQFLPDTLAVYRKSQKFLTSKGTPDGLLMLLKPEERTFITGSGTVQAKRGSRATLAVSELATFLNRQQYNTGLVNLITDLYDCRDRDVEITRGRGEEPLKDIYVTLAGAVTPTGLEESLPTEAIGGGLMSRVIPVYQDLPSKIYARPKPIVGYPTPPDIAPKLAWIASTAQGEYAFTPEAEEAFDSWYRAWKGKIIEGVLQLREDENRRDILLRKTAMLMRVQEYRPGCEITLTNFLDAKRLLDYTLSRSANMMTGIGTSEYTKRLIQVRDYLSARGAVYRRDLLQRFSRNLRSETLTEILNQLIQEGFLQVELDGKLQDTAGSKGTELYSIRPEVEDD